MGVDSRLALEIFPRVVGSHVSQFRVRFAFVKMQERFLCSCNLLCGMKGTNGKVTCDR
jgi:hypothetical protein